MKKSIKLAPMEPVPTKKWNNLLDIINQKTHATVYTLEYAREDPDMPKEPGITQGNDGIYLIVIDAKELTKTNINAALSKLTEKTGIEYKF